MGKPFRPFNCRKKFFLKEAFVHNLFMIAKALFDMVQEEEVG